MERSTSACGKYFPVSHNESLIVAQFQANYLIVGNATEAESIIGDTMGYDNDYMKSVYRYLHNLYARQLMKN